jgi:phenylacetaldehyde dehydrogenase
MDVQDIFAITAEARAFVGAKRRMFIDGELVDAADGAVIDVLNPATGAHLTTVPRGRAPDVDRAVAAAARALQEGVWARCAPAERQAALLRVADRLERDRLTVAQIESIDNGKPISEALIDVDGAAGVIRYMAGWATKIDGRSFALSGSRNVMAYTRQEPIGVVGAIIPWNFPLGMAAWKLAAPLAVGCSIILKPSELACLSVLRLAEHIRAAGIPRGVVNIVTGFGEEAGGRLSEHPGVNKLAFTGSTAVGRTVAGNAARRVAPVTLELGGKSPMIVFDDCDVEKIVPGLAAGIFFNQGQVCTAGSRLYVQDALYNDVVEALGRYADEIVVGSGQDPLSQMGPLISAKQRSVVLGYISSGDEAGARRMTRTDPVLDSAGFFVRPTVFADVANSMRIAREEIFGPVLSCAPFSTTEEAISLANDTAYGLSASVWTKSLARAQTVVADLQAGTVWINTHNPVDAALPFGGVKGSGYGRELGPEQLNAYLSTKSVWVAPEP